MKLNLDFYKEDIIYNKLDNEDEIVQQFFSNYNQKNIDKLLENTSRIDDLLACSDIRTNIISWYPFKKNATILEIGAGLGQITGELCKNAGKVVSVEFSKARGQAIANKYKNQKNLEIVVGNLKEINFNEKFDYITLIGTLEYAPKIYETDNPFNDLLEYLKSLLKEDGKILIATDNKFAMRNWAVTEIHEKNLGHNAVCSSKPIDRCQLFSKRKIEEMLNKIGFNQFKFYYPLPDYKFTNVVYTDKYLPDKSSIHRNMSLFYENQILSFHENDAYIQLIEEDKQLFKMYANSFFIEISNDSAKDNEIRYVSFWNNRNRQYRLKTVMQADKVYKYPTSELAKKHIDEIKKNIDIMRKSSIQTVDSYDEEKIISDYHENSEAYDKLIVNAYKQKGIEEVIKLIDDFKNAVIKKLEKTTSKNNIFKKNNIDCDEELIKNMNFVKDGIWDLNFHNCLVIDGQLYMYDQEWMEPNIPVEFILYRGIIIFNELNSLLDRNVLLERLNLKQYETIFNKLEEVITSKIISNHAVSIWNRPVKNVRGLYVENDRYRREILDLKEQVNNNLKKISEQEQIILDITKQKNVLETKVNKKKWL